MISVWVFAAIAVIHTQLTVSTNQQSVLELFPGFTQLVARVQQLERLEKAKAQQLKQIEANMQELEQVKKTLIKDFWPAGTYTLVKPKSGCPSGWKEGWRSQDNEDSNNKNEVTSGHHFFGSFGRNTKFHYCTKDKHNKEWGSWPKGNYCIMRQGSSCPTGFQTGSIYWDDEDASNNFNTHTGTLPSGVYDRNTRINYCCRSDGSSSSQMELPVNNPFYLLRFKSSCQAVKGMSVREEIRKTDDEDKNNKNKNQGSHPLNDGGKNNKLHYCYYYR